TDPVAEVPGRPRRGDPQEGVAERHLLGSLAGDEVQSPAPLEPLDVLGPAPPPGGLVIAQRIRPPGQLPVVPDHLLPEPLDQVDVPDPQLDHPPLLSHAPILEVGLTPPSGRRDASAPFACSPHWKLAAARAGLETRRRGREIDLEIPDGGHD